MFVSFRDKFFKLTEPSATKPKSAIDDLFADADSDEDSDIFSPKNTVKKEHTKEPSDNIQSANTENKSKKFLDVVAPGFANNIATSTPDSNVKTSGLFSDDENDDADLFGNSKKQSYKSSSALFSANTTRESNRKVNSIHVAFFDIEIYDESSIKHYIATLNNFISF